MKLNKILFSAALLSAALTASAQEQPAAKTVYDFNPHWYVQAQIGGQYTLGEVKFKELVSPNAQVALGYQFNPVFGMRLAVGGWQSRAGWKVAPFSTLAADGTERAYAGGNYKWKYKYVAPALDFTFNLSNLFCGFNPNRLVNVSAFLGAGANIAFDNDEAQDVSNYLSSTVFPNTNQNLEYLWDGTKTRFVGRGGVMVDFRLSDRVSLGCEFNANVLNDKYNSKKAGNPDWYFNGLVGVKINLGGKTYTARTVEAPKPVERIVERVVEKQVPAPAPEKKPVKQIQLRRDVFFPINVTKVQTSEEKKLQDIVDYMNEYPETNVHIVGYADRGTGTRAINKKLAGERSKNVAKDLEEKGVDPTRISYEEKGDVVQPFQENDKNRVSICIVK